MKRRSLLNALTISPIAMGISHLLPFGEILKNSQNSKRSEQFNSKENYFKNYIPGHENQRTLNYLEHYTNLKNPILHAPIILEGYVGTGKTELLIATKRKYESLFSFKVQHISGFKFTNDVIRNLRSGSLDQFHKDQYAYDVYIIDSIDSLSRGHLVQNEFLNLLKYYRQANKQVFCSFVKNEVSLCKFSKHIQSHLEESTWLKVEPAEKESRFKIAQNFAQDHALDLSKDYLQKLAYQNNSVRKIQLDIYQHKIFAESYI